MLYEYHELMGVSPPLYKKCHVTLLPAGLLEATLTMHQSSHYQHRVPLCKSGVDRCRGCEIWLLCLQLATAFFLVGEFRVGVEENKI